MKTEPIYFLRNRPAIFNLGDYLCTPYHYFNFGVFCTQSGFLIKNRPHKVILGGGAYNDLGLNQPVDFDKTILWGVGSSIHGTTSEAIKTKELPYFLWGARDPDAVEDKKKVLPCVSCLHPITDILPGKKTAVFLNKDSSITDFNQINFAKINQEFDVEVYTNYLDEISFSRCFSRANRIITNSYHVSYWSLLTGREVAIIGYSSKFRSLLKLFNLSPIIFPYDTKDKKNLEDLIFSVLKQKQFHKVHSAVDYKIDFRRRNAQFANMCLANNFCRKIELVQQTKFLQQRRTLLYRLYNWGRSQLL
jgi:hypothetical protein